MDNNVETLTLDHESPRAPQITGCSASLRPHQLAALYRAKEIEKGRFSGGNIAACIESRIAVLGDPVGTGKSYIVLGIVATDEHHQIVHPRVTHTWAGGKVAVTRLSPLLYVDCTIIVIHHHNVRQWERIMCEFRPSIRFVTISCRKELSSMLRVRDMLRDRNVVLVTSTFYQPFLHRTNSENINFKRIIFDEADNINIPSSMQPNATFYWFVTASYINLLHPLGSSECRGICNAGVVRDIWCQVSQCPLANLLVVRSNASFAYTGVEIPDMQYSMVRCCSPMSRWPDPRAIVELLAEGNAQIVARCMLLCQKGNEDTIIQRCVKNYEETIQKMHTNIATLEHLADVGGNGHVDAYTAQIERSRWRIQEHDAKILSVRTRVQEADACSICLEPLCSSKKCTSSGTPSIVRSATTETHCCPNKRGQTKCVVPCCATSFCFSCILKWTCMRGTCPICKSSLNVNDLLLICEETTGSNDSNDLTTLSGNTKIENMLTIIANTREDSRCLLFADSTDDVSEALTKNAIPHSLLKGNAMRVASVMDKFRDGRFKVLLINSKHFGAGQDMSFATDVIAFQRIDDAIRHQVIGRAQRPGRTAPLSVFYLLHDEELAQT